MSLFENSSYHYHETVFVFFNNAKRPSATDVEAAIKKLRYKIVEQNESDGVFESITVVSDLDFAGMDIAYVERDEVQSSLEEVQEQLKTTTLLGEDREKVTKLSDCDARFDIFHFEKMAGDEPGEMLNPGALLLVLNALCELTDGCAIDPQTLTVY